MRCSWGRGGRLPLPVQNAENLCGAPGARHTIALIVVPWCAPGYTGRAFHHQISSGKHDKIIEAISHSLSRYIPVGRESTRAGLQAAFTEIVTRSGEITQELRKRAALILASLALFFFTVFYILTQRIRIGAYIKVRIPGTYMPLYEKLTQNVGAALRGALRAVFIDQTIKALVNLRSTASSLSARECSRWSIPVGFSLSGANGHLRSIAVYLFVFATTLRARDVLAVGSATLLVAHHTAQAGERRRSPLSFY